MYSGDILCFLYVIYRKINTETSYTGAEILVNDALLLTNIRSVLSAGFSQRQITAAIRILYQSDRAGRESGPAIYLYKSNSTRYGYPERQYLYNDSRGNLTERTLYWRMDTFSVEAIGAAIPDTQEDLSPTDLLQTAADIVESDSVVSQFRGLHIGIGRVQFKNISYTTDTDDRYLQVPLLEFNLSHFVTHDGEVPVATGIHTIQSVC